MKFKLLLFFVLLSSFVVAKQPIQQSDFDNQLTIIFPKSEAFSQNFEGDIHFHVHNSTGYVLNNSEVDCFIHLYNTTNSHILTAKLEGNGNGIDLEFELNSSHTKDLGVHSFIVWCNSSVEAGFISGPFEISKSGKSVVDEVKRLSVIILLPFLLSILLIIGAWSLSDEHVVIRITLFLLSFVPFFASAHFALLTIIEYYNFPALEVALGDTIFWIGISFVMLITYFIIYAFWKMSKKPIDDEGGFSY